MKISGLILICTVFTGNLWSQYCYPENGNVVIYSNFEGGVLNINCDEDIPNLKIGVCTYEDCLVNITGPFAGNVTQVIYAGFQGDNDVCGDGLTSTSISGVPEEFTSVNLSPSGAFVDSSGNPVINCGYSCSDSQSPCNSLYDIIWYFLWQLDGSLHSYHTQYECWNGATFNVSDHLCCEALVPGIDLNIIVSDEIICVGQCVNYTAETSGLPTNYLWVFEGAVPTSNLSTDESPSGICYTEPGVFSSWVHASDENTGGEAEITVTVISCGNLGCTYPDALNFNPTATVDDLSCEFNCDEEGVSCLGDFNLDGLVNATDLLLFLGNYGEVCE